MHDEIIAIVRFAVLDRLGDLHYFLFLFQRVFVASNRCYEGELEQAQHFRPFEFQLL